MKQMCVPYLSRHTFGPGLFFARQQDHMTKEKKYQFEAGEAGTEVAGVL